LRKKEPRETNIDLSSAVDSPRTELMSKRGTSEMSYPSLQGSATGFVKNVAVEKDFPRHSRRIRRDLAATKMLSAKSPLIKKEKAEKSKYLLG
jgi:hypothetical protein